ncbi:E3 ubiquitin-protein ligase TRIM7-like isoform X2 [Arapaima gigas]
MRGLGADALWPLQEQTDALEDQVTCEFRHLREFLDREEEDVRGHLREEKDRRLMQLDASLKHSMEQITLLERSATQLQLRLKTKENSALLRGIRDFILRTEMLFQPPPVVSTDLQLGQFVGPLQYRVWRKMRSIMNPGTLRSMWCRKVSLL